MTCCGIMRYLSMLWMSSCSEIAHISQSTAANWDCVAYALWVQTTHYHNDSGLYLTMGAYDDQTGKRAVG